MKTATWSSIFVLQPWGVSHAKSIPITFMFPEKDPGIQLQDFPLR
jgi:hypothetical protein